ncbi:MAG: hypothetical protein KAW12_28770 [Candidatus Aminicenantes bacterium]|nr:hypothetical protein [Candidatus Aminicenantes bacterium]
MTINKKGLFVFIVILFKILQPISAFAQEEKRILMLSSGAKHGFYYRSAVDIIGICEKVFDSVEIVNMITTGSLKNLDHLKDGIADFAILQRDVALRYYYHPQTPFRNFEVVMPLFPEALQIFINGKPGIIEFSDFKKRIESGEIKRFSIGEPESVSNKTVRLILSLFGVDNDNDFFDERPFSDSLEDFKVERVFALGLMIGYPLPQFLSTKNDKIGLVSFAEPELQHILSHIGHLDKIKFPGNIYPFLSDSQIINCVGTWAFLVSKTGVIGSITVKKNETFVGKIVSEILKSKNNTPLYRTYGKGGEFESRISGGNHIVEPKSKNYLYFFRGLPIVEELESCFPGTSFPAHIYLLLVFAFTILILFFYRYHQKIDYYRYWVRYKHFFYSGIFLIVSFFILSQVIIIMENNFFRNFSVKSAIVHLSIVDVQIWLFTFVLTGFNNAIFPLSFGGRIAASIAAYIGWFAAILSIVTEFIFNYNKKKRKSGMKKQKHTDHIVICGWNESVPRFIKKSISGLQTSFVNRKKKLVVISPKIKDYLEHDLTLQNFHNRNELEIINGEPRNLKSLEFSNIVYAKTVVLLADDLTIEADERTLLRALAISKYTRQVTHRNIDSIYIIAEINHPEFRESLLEADVNEVICSSEMTENLVIESMFNHGVANVINNLLSYNERNEIYIIDIKECPFLADKHFDGLLVFLRKYGMQLLGIKINFFDKQGLQIIDRKEIEKRLKAIGLLKEDIINPVCDEENHYKTSIHDHLLVLALDENVIKQFKKNH